VVVVNHRNVPVDLSALLADGAEADWQYPVGGNVLIPHAAVCVGLKGCRHQIRSCFMNKIKSLATRLARCNCGVVTKVNSLEGLLSEGKERASYFGR
jgi:hypothetical protein